MYVAIFTLSDAKHFRLMAAKLRRATFDADSHALAAVDWRRHSGRMPVDETSLRPVKAVICAAFK